MSNSVNSIGACLCLFSILTYGEPVSAQAQRVTTNTTFSNPVQLPGVLLPAGTYQFAVASDRRSVVVSDADRRIVATLMVVPVTRAQRGTVILMRPSIGGAAPEVTALYLDGGTNGFEFVRPAAPK
jgi:hypothetical protein